MTKEGNGRHLPLSSPHSAVGEDWGTARVSWISKLEQCGREWAYM